MKDKKKIRLLREALVQAELVVHDLKCEIAVLSGEQPPSWPKGLKERV